MVPASMFSPHAQPTRPEMRHLPVDQPAGEITATPFDDRVQPVENADCKRMLRPRIVQHDGAVALPDQGPDLEIDVARLARGAVDLRPLVEVDIGSIGITEAGAFLFDVEEALLAAAAERFRMHSHFEGCMSLFRRRHARHTRTSSS
jgi:hypothetical protein